jgi:type IV pilus assembly protein PilQ
MRRWLERRLFWRVAVPVIVVAGAMTLGQRRALATGAAGPGLSGRAMTLVDEVWRRATLARFGEPASSAPRPVLRAVRARTDSGGATTVEILGAGKLGAAAVQSVANPPRVVLDFAGVVPATPYVTAIGQDPVERVRVATNSVNPLVTRVVLDLTRDAAYTVSTHGDGAVHVTFERAKPSYTAPAAVVDPAPEPSVAPAPSDAPAPAVEIVDAIPVLAASELPLATEFTSPQPPPAAALAGAVTGSRTQAAAAPTGAARNGGRPVASPQPPPDPIVSAQTQPPPPSPVPVMETVTLPPPLPVPDMPTAGRPLGQTPPPQTPTVQQPTPALQQQTGERVYTGDPISLDFQGVDLRAVLRTFAEISKLNIVIDPKVQGAVDVSLRDVPWDQALEIILRSNRLGYVVDGSIIRIAPLEVLAEEERARSELMKQQALAGELKVMTRTLSYAKASQVAPLLTRSALSTRGQIQVDERTNTLIIVDLQQNLDTSNALIGSLDQAQPQVEIEARIVKTNRRFAREIGVRLGLGGEMSARLGNTSNLAFPNQGVIVGESSRDVGLPGVSTSEAATSVAALALRSINGAVNLDVAIAALERENKVRLLSAPRVTTQNNFEAEIVQGTEIPIQVISNNTVTVTFKDAALKLRVRPQITASKTVILNISLENGTPGEVAPNGNRAVDTDRATTQVLVTDGATTVIGGINKNTQDDLQRRTPGLYRVPLLGWLFKNNRNIEEDAELLIFITPRILQL